MSTTDELVPVLKRLRLSGILHTLPLRVRQVVEDNVDTTEFLYRLLSDEVERRDAKMLMTRLREAHFEHGKSLEDFDFTFNPKIPKAQLIELATCTFVARQENVLMVGPCGVGKSHLAQALGHRAVRCGHRVLFTTAAQMFRELRAGRGDRSYDRRMLKFTKPHLLIVDDLGLRPLRYEEPEDLHDIIRTRYEQGSIIFTSNRDVEEWAPMFTDPLMASAAMDRLLHHAHIVTLEGQSFRNPRKRNAA